MSCVLCPFSFPSCFPYFLAVAMQKSAFSLSRCLFFPLYLITLRSFNNLAFYALQMLSSGNGLAVLVYSSSHRMHFSHSHPVIK